MQYMGKVLAFLTHRKAVQNSRFDSHEYTPTDLQLTPEMTKQGFVQVDQRIVHAASVVAEPIYT